MTCRELNQIRKEDGRRGINPLMCWPNTQRVLNPFDSLDSGKFSDSLLEVYVK